MGSRLTQFVKSHREVVLLLVILVTCAGFYLFQPGGQDKFLTVSNWRTIANAISTDALMVVGMTLVIIAGGFDLSVGSTLALAAIVTCKMIVAGWAIAVAVAAGLAIGAGVGAVNGFIITKVGVNPLITTLGTMTIVRGLALVITQAQPVSGLPAAFGTMGESLRLTATFDIPYPVLLMVVTVVAADLLLRHSRFLRQVYYVGGNEEAARFCGIRVDWVRSFTYILTGLLAGAAGIVQASQLTSGSANFGDRAELRVITAVVIGGASLAGGEGTILGAFLGLLFVGIVEAGMSILDVSVYTKNVVLGTILILAVSIDRISLDKIRRMIHWFKT